METIQDIVTDVDNLYYDKPKRIDWDNYYLMIAFVVAQRSFDPSTKCGCVLVSSKNKVLSTGYNGPIKNSCDSLIPLTRPAKYLHFIHSEENAILAYNGSDSDIQNAKAYITSRPCHRCLRMLLQKGITSIVYSDLLTKVVDKEDLEAQEMMLHNRNINIKEISSEIVKIGLLNTISYIDTKKGNS